MVVLLDPRSLLPLQVDVQKAFENSGEPRVAVPENDQLPCPIKLSRGNLCEDFYIQRLEVAKHWAAFGAHSRTLRLAHSLWHLCATQPGQRPNWPKVWNVFKGGFHLSGALGKQPPPHRRVIGVLCWMVSSCSVWE